MPSADSSTEDTLDLRLTPEVLALFADTPMSPDGGGADSTAPGAARTGDGGRADAGGADGSAADGSGASGGAPGGDPGRGPGRDPGVLGPADDSRSLLLDHLPAWGVTGTPHGSFRLVPVQPARDLALITRWMNDPAVTQFWELAGGEHLTAKHLDAQLQGDGRSVPCLGVLDGTPMSYWEIYRADLDPVARHYPARPHDTGVHLLIGGVADRARGVGGTLLHTVADLILDHRPACTRVIAEPDLRNTPSVAAFLTAGFRFSAEVDLPGKRAALMIRERALRHLR